MHQQQALSSRAAHAVRLLETLLAGTWSAAFDRLVETTTTELRSDGALLSLLTDRQVSIAACGTLAPQICRGTEISFDDTICANVLRGDSPLVVPDTALDARVSSVPAVHAGDLGAYLGVPVHCHEDVVGVLCAYSSRPRPWTDEDIATLVRLAGQAGIELQQAEARS